MALPLILLAASSAISAIGSFMQGNAEAEAANQAAHLREIEAQEVLARLNINRRSIFDQGERFKVHQRSAIAKQGVLSDDSTLSSLEDTNAQVTREVYSAEREANFRAQGLMAEAGMMREKGAELRSAGYLHGAGTLLTAGFTAYQYGQLGKIADKIAPDQSPFTLSTWDLGSGNTRDIGQFGYGWK